MGEGGVEVMVEVEGRRDVGGVELAKMRGGLKGEVRRCEDCSRGRAECVRGVVRMREEDRFVVVVSYPNSVTSAGWRMLNDVIEKEMGKVKYGVTYGAWCGGEKKPSDMEFKACRGKLLKGMGVSGVGLLVGAEAMRLWRKDLLLKDWVGEIGIWLGRWVVVACPNPNNKYARDGVEKAVGMLRWACEEMEHGGQVLNGLRMVCEGCREAWVDWWDVDGVPWCKVCKIEQVSIARRRERGVGKGVGRGVGRGVGKGWEESRVFWDGVESFGQLRIGEW